MKYFVSCDYVRRNLLFACLHVNAKMMSDGWAWKVLSKDRCIALQCFSLIENVLLHFFLVCLDERENIFWKANINQNVRLQKWFYTRRDVVCGRMWKICSIKLGKWSKLFCSMLKTEISKMTVASWQNCLKS